MDIAKEIGMPALLGQAAEECMELGKALLKLQRIQLGTNPTPVTEDQARADILEEGTDVVVCCCALNDSGVLTYDYIQGEEKLKRWEQRITEARNE